MVGGQEPVAVGDVHPGGGEVGEGQVHHLPEAAVAAVFPPVAARCEELGDPHGADRCAMPSLARGLFGDLLEHRRDVAGP